MTEKMRVPTKDEFAAFIDAVIDPYWEAPERSGNFSKRDVMKMKVLATTFKIYAFMSPQFREAYLRVHYAMQDEAQPVKMAGNPDFDIRDFIEAGEDADNNAYSDVFTNVSDDQMRRAQERADEIDRLINGDDDDES